MVGKLVVESCLYVVICCVRVGLQHIGEVTDSVPGVFTCSKAKHCVHKHDSRLKIQSESQNLRIFMSQ